MHVPLLPQVLARRLRLAGDFDFKLIAQRTPGFVGADLQALTKEAAAVAIKRIFSQLGALPPPAAAVGDLMDAGTVRSRQDAVSHMHSVWTWYVSRDIVGAVTVHDGGLCDAG